MPRLQQPPPQYDQRLYRNVHDEPGGKLPAHVRMTTEPPVKWRKIMAAKSRYLEILLIGGGFVRGSEVSDAGKIYVTTLAATYNLPDWPQIETPEQFDQLIEVVRATLDKRPTRRFVLVGESYTPAEKYPRLAFMTPLPPEATLEECIVRLAAVGFQMHVHSHPTYQHCRKDESRGEHTLEIRGDCYSHDRHLSVYHEAFQVVGGWNKQGNHITMTGTRYVNAAHTMYGATKELVRKFNRWLVEVEEARIEREARRNQLLLTADDKPKRRKK